MALDVDLTIHDRLWTLIEASTSLQALLGTQLKATDTARLIRDRAAQLPAQFPKIVINAAGGLAAKSQPSVFGQKDGGSSTVDYGVPMTRRFSINLIYDRIELGQQTPVEAALLAALYAGGRTLGIAWVGDCTFSAERRDQNSEMTGRVLRTVYTITATVDARPKLSLLTA